MTTVTLIQKVNVETRKKVTASGIFGALIINKLTGTENYRNPIETNEITLKKTIKVPANITPGMILDDAEDIEGNGCKINQVRIKNGKVYCTVKLHSRTHSQSSVDRMYENGWK